MRHIHAIAPLTAKAPEVGAALAILEDARQRTLRALDGITQEELDWQPPDTLNAIGTLLYHIAAIEGSWVYEDVLQSWDPRLDVLFPFDVRDGDGRLTPVIGANLDDHLRRMRVMRSLTLSAYCEMSLEDFRRPRTMPDYDVTPEWVLNHLLQHEAEHRGQISDLRTRAALLR